jgi:hypothetical protein
LRSGNQPVFRPDLRKGLKVAIRCQDFDSHLPGQGGDHLIHGREDPARQAQLLVNFAIETRSFQIDRPQADIPQKSMKVLTIFFGPPDLLDADLQLAENRYAGGESKARESALFEPVSNGRVTCNRLAQMVGVE